MLYNGKGIRGAGGSKGGGGGGGDVFLRPPDAGTEAYQSISFLKSLELVSEGKIFGPVKSDGSKALGIDVLESVFYDETRIKEPSEINDFQENLKFGDVQLVDRLTSTSFGLAIQNCIDNIEDNYASIPSGAFPKQAETSGFWSDYVQELNVKKTDLVNFVDKNESELAHLGIIQYNPSNRFTGLGHILSGSPTEQYSSSVYNGDSFQSRQIQKQDGSFIKIPESVNFIVANFLDSASSVNVGISTVFKVSGFFGGLMDFFYIGDQVSTGSNGEFLTGKFLFSTGDSDVDNKIQSGINNNYDTFIYSNDSISFSTAAQTQKTPARGETIGNDFKLNVISTKNLKFNFTNSYVDFTLGKEEQEKLENFSEISREIQIEQDIFGPFVYGGDANVGSGNDDVRHSNNFSTWKLNMPEESEEFSYTHTITQREVDDIEVSFVITQLRDTRASGQDHVGKDDPETLRLRIEYGFEGDSVIDFDGLDNLESYLSFGYSPQTIYLNQLQQEEDFSFHGIIRNPYLFDASLSQPLRKNSILKNKTVDDIQGMTTDLKNEYNLDGSQVLFPGDTWKNVNRYAKIRKLDFETESILIFRDVKIGAVTEKINSNFTYPSSAIFGNVIDARTFNSVPTRSYDLRLKEVLVPSNYQPLNSDGTDKRFIEDSSSYGLREIQTFDGSTYIKVPDKIDLGTENYEISFKVKFGSFNTTTTPVYFIDVDGGDFNTPGRVAVYHRDNGGGSSPEIGMVGKDDAGNTDFSNKDISISAYSTSDVFAVSLKAVGSKYTLTVKVGETLVGTQTGTLTNRPSFSYDPASGKSLLIGASTAKTANSFQDNGTQIADYKIKKNNQLLHYWDGTVIDTVRLGNCFKDRFGGNHGEIIGTANAVEDSGFDFGKNKEQIYVGEWDGSFKLAWTDNPAWILYDLMINNIYGIGSRIDDKEDIDIFNLYLIARYCDAVDEDGFFDGLTDDIGGLEPRFSCNLLLKSEENAFQVIGNIASIFRSITYWENSSFNFTIDKPKELMATFNNGNVFDGNFNYGDLASNARFSRVEVLYSDKKDDFKLKKEYIEDEDAIKKFGLITNEQNGIGCTSKSQARRLGKYILFSNKLETETINFNAGQVCLFLSPGDIIRVDDELKNFEINYGKVLEINTGEGYIQIEKTVNTGSIQTGEQGGLYLYNNKKQEEIKDLYDIVNFELSYTGVLDDQNVYSGVLQKEKLENIRNAQISKFYITGFESDVASNKIYIDKTQSNYEDITGVRRNSFFNLELNNDVSEYYKVIRVSEVEKNIYEVQGIQYNEEKFNLIEEEDFDITETSYSIGVPTNTINTPSAPLGVSTGIALNNIGFYDLTGVITGQVGGTETKYRVSLTAPNGDYIFKNFLKDEQLSPPQTTFEFNDLKTVGSYQLTVTSLKNPESKETVIGSFELPYPNKKRNNHIIKDVKILNGVDLGGSGLQTEGSVKLNIELEDFCENWLSFNSRERPYLKVNLLDESNQNIGIIENNLRSNQFMLTKLENQNYFSQLNRFYGFEFKLYDRNNILHDTCSYFISNEIPRINSFQISNESNSINFNLNFDAGERDIDKIEVYKSNSPYSGFELAFTETENIKSFNISKDFFYNSGAYDTGLYYYKILPFDDFSSGEFTEISSGFLSLNLAETTIEPQKTQIIETVWFAQGSGNNIGSSSNNATSCLLRTSGNNISYKYIFDLSFELQSDNSGIAEVSFSGLNAAEEIKFNLIANSGKTEVYQTKMLQVTNTDNYELSILGSGCSVNDFNISIDQIKSF